MHVQSTALRHFIAGVSISLYGHPSRIKSGGQTAGGPDSASFAQAQQIDPKTTQSDFRFI